ncbi:MAGUK p55 subfamily member 5-like isoform X2 [Gigantopelta aegis]|nr:MAGUK p55 subfamily member 5-like isoform X2 [Gigantopelta aegis]XP_041353632.1 MAGUK p55 subfamily member 5-like isoform X2 [Gigantopelta aegis]XP_041353633.1 MAGUK p55 subfamily member 5-like isoform X2 [Gigantopelta aegis]
MIKLSSESHKSTDKSPQHSDTFVKDTVTNTVSMPIGKSPKKKANGHASNGEMNGNTQFIEMNGYLENDTPKKGKGKSKKDGKRQKVERNSEAPLIEDLDAQGLLAPNGHPLSQNLQNRSRENITDSEVEHSSFEFEDPGPHREMAVDCPDGFVATVKGPPRYPPTQPHTPRGSQMTPVKSLNSSRDYYESDPSLATGAGSVPNNQMQPTMEQLERLRHHQEELRKRREEEEKLNEENEFLRTSIRGSKKLQALEGNKKVLPTGICNTAFMDGEEEDMYDGMPAAPLPQLTGKENYMKQNIGIEDLFQSLHHIRSELNSSEDQSEIKFVNNVFHNRQFQQAVQIHQKIVDITSQSPPPKPTAVNSQDITNDVFNVVQNSPDPYARELANLLRNPHLTTLLQAHDAIAEQQHKSVADVQLDEGLEYSLIPYGEDTVKIIHLEKTNEPLGATVKNDGDRVVIGRIVKGGAAEKSGLLQEGDEILDVNGINIQGKNVNDVSEMLANMSGTITFMIVPNHSYSSPTPTPTPRTDMTHMKALFHYDPEDDLYIPCRELGISFRKGDILHVINQDDAHWWQAYRDGEEDQSLAGLIPSKTFQEQREALKQSLPADGKENKRKGRSCVCGKTNKKKKKKKKSSLYSGTGEETEEILTYEEVARYLPQPNRKRPIVLIGPSNVGRQELRQRLMESDYDRFAAAVPHTSRTRKEEEIDGKDYHFISRTAFEDDISANKFVEYGEFEKNLYGTSVHAIRQVVNKGQICVLNLHPESLKMLHSSDLKPYVIFICPPNLEKLRALHQKLGKAGIPDEELREIIEKAREVEDVYGHLFDYILVNMDIDRSYDELLREINRLEMEPQWVPKHWLDANYM